MSTNKTREELFWAKVDKTDACWLWTASKRWNGYGVFWDGERVTGAHQFSFALAGGVVPEGLELDHLCRVRHCVNPDHLEPVTRRENTMRGDAALPHGKTHCPHGHPYDEANTYYWRGRLRWCKTCRNARRRKNPVREEVA